MLGKDTHRKRRLHDSPDFDKALRFFLLSGFLCTILSVLVRLELSLFIQHLPNGLSVEGILLECISGDRADD